MGSFGFRARGTRGRTRAVEYGRWLRSSRTRPHWRILRATLEDKARNAEFLADADTLQKALLNSISHNVRTPLASIIGVLSTLQEEEILIRQPVRRDLIDTARQEAERLNRLFGNLLDLSRLEAGALRIRKDPCDVQDLIGAALEQLGVRRREPSRSIVTIAPDLPFVPMDFVLIVQVLVNLLDNALKYSPAGPSITVEARVLLSSLEVSCLGLWRRYRGSDLAHVFEKFNRGGRSGETGGIGLGLSICKGVDRGASWNKYGRNAGAREEPQLRSPCPSNRRDEKPGARNCVRVLVVDDEHGIRKFLRTSLSTQGYELFEAATGQEALQAVPINRPDVIVLDLGLPDLDGIDVTRTLREWTEIPILILSVRDRESEKVAALDAGADDYLTKPFGVGELLARIRAALRRANKPENTAVFEAGDLHVDLAKRIVQVRRQNVQLTPTEYDLLKALVRHPDRVLTHRHLIREVWGGACYEDEMHLLRVNMSNLRRKLESDPTRPRHVVTEPGVGYQAANGIAKSPALTLS